jgi:hypothetical protein
MVPRAVADVRKAFLLLAKGELVAMSYKFDPRIAELFPNGGLAPAAGAL